jgi:hypothetical protein
MFVAFINLYPVSLRHIFCLADLWRALALVAPSAGNKDLYIYYTI